MPEKQKPPAQDWEEPKGFSARDLINEMEEEEGTFDIPLKNGKHITVRKVVNYRTIVSLRKRAADIFRAAKQGAIPPTWKPFLPITEQVADIIADITGLVVNPKFTDLEVLELCQKAGLTAVYLHGLIKQSWTESVPAAEEEAILLEKEP